MVDQEQRNKRLAYTLIGLVVITVAIAGLQWKKNPAVVDKAIFRVVDQTSVDRVELRSARDTVILHYDGVRWKVNSRYDAESRLVTVLFATLAQAEPRRKAPESLVDSLRSQLVQKGVLVDLYAGERKINSFYAGGDERKSTAWFMDDGGTPYLMTIPGYRVYVAGIFELDENGWKEKRIFNFNWRNFKTLTARTADGGQDIVVQPGDEGFVVAGITVADTTRLNDYLDAVSLLQADEFIASGYAARYDSLLRTTPVLTIDVTDLGNKTYRLRLYAPLPGERLVLGQTGDQEIALFDRQALNPILKGREFFRAAPQ